MGPPSHGPAHTARVIFTRARDRRARRRAPCRPRGSPPRRRARPDGARCRSGSGRTASPPARAARARPRRARRRPRGRSHGDACGVGRARQAPRAGPRRSATPRRPTRGSRTRARRRAAAAAKITVPHTCERVAVTRAHVERDRRAAGNHVARPGRRLDAPDRRDGARLGARELARPRRPCAQRPRARRDGPPSASCLRGSRRPRTSRASARAARGRCAIPSGRRHVDERDPLLDVHLEPERDPLEPGGRVARATCGVTPRAAASSPQGAPVAIDAREQRVDLELAAEHPAAEDGRVEARALLVDHAADRERPTRRHGGSRRTASTATSAATTPSAPS